jgi:hypothetical protein
MSENENFLSGISNILTAQIMRTKSTFATLSRFFSKGKKVVVLNWKVLLN